MYQVKGQPTQYLAAFAPATSGYGWNPSLPATLAADPKAASLVAAGQGDTLIAYPVFDGLPSGLDTKLTILPVIQIPAYQIAAANWPPGFASRGADTYPTDKNGNVAQGANIVVFLPTPLKQLAANQYIANYQNPIGVSMPVVYEDDAVASVPPGTLGTQAQTCYLTPAQQAGIVEKMGI